MDKIVEKVRSYFDYLLLSSNVIAIIYVASTANETAKLQYGKENISKNSLNEAFAHSTKSAVDSSAYKDEPQHKPQRYSTQRLKQGHSNSANTTATATAVVDPNSNFRSPIQNQLSSDSKQKSPQTQEQGNDIQCNLSNPTVW